MSSNLIKHIQTYVSLKDDEVALLLKSVAIKHFKKKAFLLSEGQICRANYFVEKGCLRMFFINEKGIEQIIYFAIENWWLSDLMSLQQSIPSQFYIQAIEDTTVSCFTAKNRELLFNEIPQLERYFRLILEKFYTASQFRFKYLYSLSKEENFIHFSTSFPEFVQRVPQYMLASYLGFTPEYLSELRKKHS